MTCWQFCHDLIRCSKCLLQRFEPLQYYVCIVVVSVRSLTNITKRVRYLSTRPFKIWTWYISREGVLHRTEVAAVFRLLQCMRTCLPKILGRQEKERRRMHAKNTILVRVGLREELAELKRTLSLAGLRLGIWIWNKTCSHIYAIPCNDRCVTVPYSILVVTQ